MRKHIAAVDQRRGEIGLYRQRLPEALQCFLVPLQCLQSASSIVECVDGFRIDLDGLVHDAFGVLKLAALEMHEAKQLEGLEMLRVCAQNFVVETRGLRKISGLVQAPGVLQHLLVHGGIARAPSTAKSAGGSPFCWRSHMCEKAASKLRVVRAVSKRRLVSRFFPSLARTDASADSSRANFSATA